MVDGAVAVVGEPVAQVCWAHQVRVHWCLTRQDRPLEDAVHRTSAAQPVGWHQSSSPAGASAVASCVWAIALATRHYDDKEPLNVGTGIGTSIKELADMFVDITGFRGSVVWDTSKPDGAMGKVLDVTRMKTQLGWEAKTPLPEGLARTVEWYERHLEQAA